MSRSPRIYASRSAAEARYRDIRRLAFKQAENELAEAGIDVSLRPIEATALEAFRSWTSRRVAWPWPEMVADWRRAHPGRFELAVWSGAALCALAIGRPSRDAAHMSLHYMEASPAPGRPLRRQVAIVVFTAADIYAAALGKQELRLVDPLPGAVPYYCSPEMGFQLVQPRGEVPYCKRRI